MKKLFYVILFFSFCSNPIFAAVKPYKVTTYTSNSDFIIYKQKRAGLVHNADRDEASWKIMLDHSASHCSSSNKKNFFITGDADHTPFAHMKYRMICANNISEAIEIQKKRVGGFSPNMDNVMNQNFTINGGDKQSVSIELAKLEKQKIKKVQIENKKKFENKKNNIEQTVLKKCETTYGFKKGTEKFADCTFKLYQAEIELEKLKLENENQRQRISLEKEKLKAANAQVDASNAQAEATRRNAEANERSANTAANERSRKMMQRGVRSLHDNCILKGTC